MPIPMDVRALVRSFQGILAIQVSHFLSQLTRVLAQNASNVTTLSGRLASNAITEARIPMDVPLLARSKYFLVVPSLSALILAILQSASNAETAREKAQRNVMISTTTTKMAVLTNA